MTSQPRSARKPPHRHLWLLWVGICVAIFVAGFFLVLRNHINVDAARRPLDAVRLTLNSGTELSPTFSPDGNRVAYSWNGPQENNFDIYVKEMGARSSVRLTTAPEADTAPAWSPDGKSIAFVRDGHLLTMAPDGSSTRVLADLGTGASSLAWSTDSRWIVSSGGPGLAAISADRGERRELTAARSDASPTMAPDGSSVVFVRQGVLCRLRLSAAMAPVGEVEIFSDTPGAQTPAFTKEGDGILYAAPEFGEHVGLWLRPLISGPARLIFTSGAEILTPTVARQKHFHLAFSERKPARRRVWKAALPGDLSAVGTATPMVASSFSESGAQFSPDGRRIAFQSTRSGTPEIWAADANGEHPIKLSDMNAPLTGSPQWSPDGEWIVFHSNKGGHFNVYQVASRGGSVRALTASDGVDGNPSWSHDGRSIYFVSDRSGTLQVWKMLASGGGARQITGNGGFRAAESWDGRWIYYTRGTGERPLYRMPSDGGAESALPQVNTSAFCVTPAGLVFVRQRAVQYFEFETATAHTLLAERNIVDISVSSDGKSLLFTTAEADSAAASIVVMENFHPFRIPAPY